MHIFASAENRSTRKTIRGRRKNEEGKDQEEEESRVENGNVKDCIFLRCIQPRFVQKNVTKKLTVSC
jgi:hypothetical protein